MTKPFIQTYPINHPEILAIAMDIILEPTRRTHYSSLVLILVDAAIEHIRNQLLTAEESLSPDLDLTKSISGPTGANLIRHVLTSTSTLERKVKE